MGKTGGAALARYDAGYQAACRDILEYISGLCEDFKDPRYAGGRAYGEIFACNQIGRHVATLIPAGHRDGIAIKFTGGNNEA